MFAVMYQPWSVGVGDPVLALVLGMVVLLLMVQVDWSFVSPRTKHLAFCVFIAVTIAAILATPLVAQEYYWPPCEDVYPAWYCLIFG